VTRGAGGVLCPCLPVLLRPSLLHHGRQRGPGDFDRVIFEPHAPPPAARMEAELSRLMRAAVDAGAPYVVPIPLRLGPGVREWFLAQFGLATRACHSRREEPEQRLSI